MVQALNSLSQPSLNRFENQLSLLPDVDVMSSSSRNNRSSIVIQFKATDRLEQNINTIRDMLSEIRKKLPENAEPTSMDIGGVVRPVLIIGFSDKKKTAEEIRDYVDRFISPSLKSLPGVGAVWVYGSSPYALRIWVDPKQMTAQKVSPSDIRSALEANNIDFPTGSIRSVNRNYPIVSNTRLKDVKSFKNLIIKKVDNQIIRLKDIATVELGASSLQDSPLRINGKPSVMLQVRPLDTANPISVGKVARAEVNKLKTSLPEGMTAKVEYDQSIFLNDSINETYKTIVEAVALVILVVFLFLGSIRAASIPIITIPVCIISAFALMNVLGFTINVLTLLALVLAIGLVVDDAIVMLENIHRYIEEGEAPFAAALKGSKQIAFAVVAMTITLAAVYAPLGFASGFTSVFFREFAFTLAGTVIISGFVALTLSPMMCSKILRNHTNENWLMLTLEKGFLGLEKYYQKLLTLVLNARTIILLILAGIVMAGIFLYKTMPAELMPREDIGFFEINASPPPGSSVHYTNKYMLQLDAILKSVPDIDSYIESVSGGSGVVFVTMKPWKERSKSTQQVIQELIPKLNNIPGLTINAEIPSPVNYGSGDDSGITVNLLSNRSYADLTTVVEDFTHTLSGLPGISRVQHNLKYDIQQFVMTLDRNLAAQLGVNVTDISSALGIMLGGRHITDIEADSNSYSVIVQMQLSDLSSFSGLSKIHVKSADGTMIPLSKLIEIKPRAGLNSLNHFQRMRSAQISISLDKTVSIGDVIKSIDAAAAKSLPDTEKIAYDGSAKDYIESAGNMQLLFGLSIIFIYLVLAAQFESFVDPLIVLFTVPLCIVGAIATLFFAGGSLNVYTNIGFITLVGLVTKHGILITQFANELQADGIDKFNAVKEAATTRFRPILMTTMAMVLGAIPLALATGPGSLSREQIGWVIVGGLSFGTFFSLVIVPIVYTLLSRRDKKVEIIVDSPQE